MKKLLKVSILLLTAALLFSGCSNASSSSEDDSLPGTWTENTGYYSSFAAPYQGSTLTGTNNTFVYTLTKPAEVADEDKPEEGTFSYYTYGVTKECKRQTESRALNKLRNNDSSLKLYENYVC